MTPDKPDIDFKLDGAIGLLFNISKGGSSHKYNLGSTYCSVITQSLYKGE